MGQFVVSGECRLYKAVVALLYNLLPPQAGTRVSYFTPTTDVQLRSAIRTVGTVKASGGFLFDIHVHYSIHMYSCSQVYAWWSLILVPKFYDKQL